MAGKGYPATQDPIGNVPLEDGLMKEFDQFSGLTSPILDWLGPDTNNVISEASLEGKSTSYEVTTWNLIATAPLQPGANI